MRTVEFHRLLDEHNALRVRFETERGQVLKFVLQLECDIQGEPWTPVIRYDTAHGFAHCDRLHPYGETLKTRLPMTDYNAALAWVMNDLLENWATYRRRYETWLKNK